MTSVDFIALLRALPIAPHRVYEKSDEAGAYWFGGTPDGNGTHPRYAWASHDDGDDVVALVIAKRGGADHFSEIDARDAGWPLVIEDRVRAMLS